MKRGLLPSHLVIDGGLIPDNFAKRLEAFKASTGPLLGQFGRLDRRGPPSASAVAEGHQAQW